MFGKAASVGPSWVPVGSALKQDVHGASVGGPAGTEGAAPRPAGDLPLRTAGKRLRFTGGAQGSVPARAARVSAADSTPRRPPRRSLRAGPRDLINFACQFQQTEPETWAQLPAGQAGEPRCGSGPAPWIGLPGLPGLVWSRGITCTQETCLGNPPC